MEQLATETGLCRRALDDAFKRHLGRTLAKELAHLRFEEAKRRLFETDEKAYAIALDVGFACGEHMNKIFHRELSMSPREFRGRRSAG